MKLRTCLRCIRHPYSKLLWRFLCIIFERLIFFCCELLEQSAFLTVFFTKPLNEIFWTFFLISSCVLCLSCQWDPKDLLGKGASGAHLDSNALNIPKTILQKYIYKLLIIVISDKSQCAKVTRSK